MQNCGTNSSPYCCSVPNIRKLASVVPEKMWQKLSCEQICLCPQYSMSRKTGSGHAADSKMRYTIQFSILMLCAKYQEAGLCGSREKCDRNFVWRRRKTTDSDPYMSPPLKGAGDAMLSMTPMMMTDNGKKFNLKSSLEPLAQVSWKFMNNCWVCVQYILQLCCRSELPLSSSLFTNWVSPHLIMPDSMSSSPAYK